MSLLQTVANILPGNQLGKPMQNVGYKWVDNGHGGVNYYDGLGKAITREQFAGQSGQNVGDIEKWVGNQYGQRNSGSVLGAQDYNAPTGGGSSTATNPADEVAFLNDQEAQLRSLLGRTDTSLNQGLTNNEDEYNRQLGGANAEKDRTYAGYQDQRVGQNQTKLSNYDTINRNAGNGFRSLSSIIGRASGTGSSAFRDLLPDVIGKDVSSKRMQANETFGQNMQSIDKAQGQYDISFADVLADLMRQKRDNENSLRSGVESQRQGINSQLGQNAAARAQAQGGGYDAVRAAQAPFQSAIDQSRNAVESFFNTFRTPYSPRPAVAATPDLSQYTADRSVVNAGNGAPVEDPSNPYASLLRKRLQGLA